MSKKYDSYKDSEIDWIGEIPSHWEVKRGKEVLNFSNGYPFNSGLFSMDENEGFPLVRIRDLKSDKITTFYKGEIVHEAMIDNNDFIIGMDGDFNIVKWNKGKALLNQRLCKIEGVNHLETNYLSYSLPFYLKIINDLTYYTTVKHLSNNDLFEQKFLVPNSQEQITIANYLDQKTSQIDDLIAKKERLIQLLEEERTAIINQAVTKGLDPTVPMKDSGIEWLGKIPEHWECNQLRRFIEDRRKVTYGIVQPGEYDPYGRFMVRGQDYSKGWAHPDTIFRVTPKIEEPYARARLKTGDILYTIVGAGVGNIAVVPEWLNEANITQTTARLAINQEKANSEYIFYFLQSMYAEIQLSIYVKGAAQPGMNLSDLKLYYFTLPPIAEQKDIAEYIKINCSRISETTNVLSKEIELIKEYKTALISEVVTGKVDIRNEKLS